MNLYIKVEDGKCVNHPAFGSNLIQAFGTIPPDWEPFERREPIIGEYEVLISSEPTYQKIDGIWVDVWEVRLMTDEERTEKDRLLSSLLTSDSPTISDEVGDDLSDDGWKNQEIAK